MALYNIPIGFKIFPLEILYQRNDIYKFSTGNKFNTKNDTSSDTSGTVSTHFLLVLLKFGHQNGE